MNKDITPLLQAWEYAGHDRVTARKIIGADGRPKLQMRLEMGILQMEMSGRPDGERPFGHDSVLDYCREAAARAMLNEGTFALDKSDCAALHHESMLYYHRRICCLELGEFLQSEEDAEHNLAIMDLLKEHAKDSQDWEASEQYRAFVVSHRTKARALRVLRERGRIAALRHVEEGEGEIRKILESYDRADLIGKTPEFELLRELREQIEKGSILTERDKLEIQLREAVSRERYEEAARLRDMILELG